MLMLRLAEKWQSWCKCGSIKVGSHPSGTVAGEAGRRKGAELSKQEVELWPVFSSLPTLQCLFAAGAY